MNCARSIEGLGALALIGLPLVAVARIRRRAR